MSKQKLPEFYQRRWGVETVEEAWRKNLTEGNVRLRARRHYLQGYTPRNYARFLDYANDRVFLQKVGGGYRFIHRLLLALPIRLARTYFFNNL